VEPGGRRAPPARARERDRPYVEKPVSAGRDV